MNKEALYLKIKNNKKWIIILSIVLLYLFILFIGTDNSIKRDMLADILGLLYDERRCLESNNGTIYIAKKGKKYGILNQNGITVLPFIYDEIDDCRKEGGGYPYYRHILYFSKPNKSGYIEINTFQEIGSYEFSTKYFHFGRASVLKNNKHGFVDSTGKEVIPCIYDYIGYFVNGSFVYGEHGIVQAKVSKDGKSFFINTNGDILEESSPTVYLTRAEMLQRLENNIKKQSERFSLGATRKEVLDIQGDPTSIRAFESLNEEWWNYYDGSQVIFRNGKVAEYTNNGNLKIKIKL